MEGKFAGLGLKNMLIVTLFVWIVTVMAKAVLTKHPVPGATELIQAV